MYILTLVTRSGLLVGLLIGVVIGAGFALLTATKGPPSTAPAQPTNTPSAQAKAGLKFLPQLKAPTPADKLPIKKIKLPAGFNVEVYASGILDARSLRQGDKGTVFVSTRLMGEGKIYAIVEKDGKRKVDVILEDLIAPNGIEFHNGALYVATPQAIMRYDNIEGNLNNPPKFELIYDKFPDSSGSIGRRNIEGLNHGWKFIAIGPDEKLYFSVGALCNICESTNGDAEIRRINLDGREEEVVARGVRNTVGFDWNPLTGDFYFTENGHDLFSEDLPNDELNRVTKIGQHFGFPYCHQGNFTDPEFGWGKNCKDYEPPVLLMGPHTVPLGMRFYTGTMFPARYRNAIFIARHGPWSRTQKLAADVVAVFLNEDGSVKSMEPFMTGFVENNVYLGRPVDVLVMKDGSLLVSDDHNHAIYRVTYGPT